VETGDKIVCDVEKRILHLEVEEQEIARRIARRKEQAQVAADSRQTDTSSRPEPWLERSGRRGYRGLYEREVNQAHEGCDFGFLTASGPGTSQSPHPV
jgi:dihydroxy-acid dehydratase